MATITLSDYEEKKRKDIAESAKQSKSGPSVLRKTLALGKGSNIFSLTVYRGKNGQLMWEKFIPVGQDAPDFLKDAVRTRNPTCVGFAYNCRSKS